MKSSAGFAQLVNALQLSKQKPAQQLTLCLVARAGQFDPSAANLDL
jgi:hypothetical protein